VLRVGGFAGLVLMVGILAGCSLFFPNDSVDQASKGSNDISSSWLIAAQGQGGPPACVKALAPGQAKKLADKALKENVEVQALAQALKGRGKKLNTFKAHGCKVKNKSQSRSSAQGLIAQQETTADATLIEVPAGSDAALYLLENSIDGNYWASLKEAADVGDRLVHLEVGLTDETGVQGLQSDGSVGQMSLLLPDETGIQEVGNQLQQLLSGSGTEQVLSAMQTDQLDWTHAEAILDESHATLLEDGSQELEAVVVIPQSTTDSGGQALWSGTQPLYDESPALYAKVAVKKTVTPSNPRPNLQVTAPPTQLKRGSELAFEPFDLCPYQQYGRVAALRKPLCSQWEQQAAPKVQKITFDRGVKALPALHNQATPNFRAAAASIMGIAGSKGGLLLVGTPGLDSQKLQQLYDQTLGSQAISQEEVEGQQLFDALRALLEALGYALTVKDLIEAVSGASPDVISSLIAVFDVVRDNIAQGDLSGAMVELEGFYNQSGTPFRIFVDALIEKLRAINLGMDHKQEALQMMLTFVKLLYDNNLSNLEGYLLNNFGFAAVIALAKLVELENAGVQDWRYPFPISPAHLLNSIRDLKERGVKGLELLMDFLAASAAQAFYYSGDAGKKEIGLEGIARVTELTWLFDKLLQLGWENLQFITQVSFDNDIGFAFQATKARLFKDGKDAKVTGFIEPFLKQEEVTALADRIQKAAQQLAFFRAEDCVFTCSYRHVIVQFVDQWDPNAVGSLCTEITNRPTARTPIVVIANGQIACTKDISPSDASRLCAALGACISSDIPVVASASSSTLEVPLPPPLPDPACNHRGRSLCLL